MRVFIVDNIRNAYIIGFNDATKNRGCQMNVQLLNAAKDQIIKIANENNINLKDEFGTPDKFKQFVFSLTIKMIMEIGSMTVEQAYNIVMGEGSFQQLSDDVWNQLNA
mgnify:CR=1 FL=1